MDLPTIAEVRLPASRADLAALSETVIPLGGGTWLFSEPQNHLTGLVDLMTLGWTPWERRTDGGLSVAATCTMAELTRIPATDGWWALPLFRECAESLLQSFKVWNTATVGGNIATALAAGALIGLGGALDAELVIWTPDGSERRQLVADFVVDQRVTTIQPGEVVRSIEFPAAAMAATTAFRRIALSPLGRAGTVLAARSDLDGAVVLCITGGTSRPEVIRFPGLPEAEELAAAVAAVPTWFTDAHGAADWRQGVSGLLAEEIRQELARSASTRSERTQ
ncbi:FAD binding domain-containing protein [uncultured Amnibacterium sp.]|uniref:FAD binding domain-containing protein n=1 Tax=uncultured Amnibacterium sp. TaxID=1631851 RepID=UPI0035CC8D54